MAKEWYVVRYNKDGKAIDKLSVKMTKSEAERVAAESQKLILIGGYTYKAVHKHDVAI